MSKEILADEQEHLQTLEDYKADILSQHPEYEGIDIDSVSEEQSEFYIDLN